MYSVRTGVGNCRQHPRQNAAALERRFKGGGYLVFLKSVDYVSEETRDVERLSPQAGRRDLEKQAERRGHLLDIRPRRLFHGGSESPEQVQCGELDPRSATEKTPLRLQAY